MKIVKLYPPYLFGMQYGDDETPDEYHRLFAQWWDLDYLVDYFEIHSPLMNVDFWGKMVDPEEASERTLGEAYEMEDYIAELSRNTALGLKPDFDEFFKPLGGEFKYIFVQTPMKAYGTLNPSLLRLYAIKLAQNCYLITGGGIKYCQKMEESPELLAEIAKIKKVRSFLLNLGIEDGEDVNSLL
jgi:hypothetical protein